MVKANHALSNSALIYKWITEAIEVVHVKFFFSSKLGQFCFRFLWTASRQVTSSRVL